MQYRHCGKSKLNLSVLGIGCWSFGGGSYWGDQDQTEVDRIVAAALDMGCNYFDTAEVYNEGRSEISLGTALSRCRSQAIIGSKVTPNATDPEALRAHCETSLQRLKTDYIDLYMIHWPINHMALKHFDPKREPSDPMPNMVAAFETLCSLQKDGKIRYFGVSNFGPKQLREIESFNTTVNELCYNLLCRGIEDEIAPLCSSSGIGIIGYMPLMQGILTGKYTSLEQIPWQRTRTRHFSGSRKDVRHNEPGFEPLLQSTLDALNSIALKTATPLTDIAIAWILKNPAVTCTVTGVRNVAQLEDSIRAVNTTLTDDTLSQLNDATLELHDSMGPIADIWESCGNSRIY